MSEKATPEQALRDAARAFQQAHADALAAGLHINWPRSADGLASLEISCTGAAPVQASKKAKKPDAKRS